MVEFFSLEYGGMLSLLVTSVLKKDVKALIIRRYIPVRTSDTPWSYSMIVASVSSFMDLSESCKEQSKMAVCSLSVSESSSLASSQ